MSNLSASFSEKVFVVGGSRGFGRAIVQALPSQFEILVASRQVNPSIFSRPVEVYSLDVTDSSRLEEFCAFLSESRPARLFYVVGGGPYGKFDSKDFKDHLWAYQVNLLAPARILYHALRVAITQIVVVGSAVAEDKPDLNAASYCSAKHGLKGLIITLQEENPNADLRLYSPGYMDTSLLPKSAKRRLGGSVIPLDVQARDFVEWVLSPHGEKHRSSPAD